MYVFDLDETLTDHPSGDTVDEAWTSRRNHVRITQMLQSIRDHGHVVVLLTRAVRTEVLTFLKTVHLLDLFDVIIGADNHTQNWDMTDRWWAIHKTKWLQALNETSDVELVFFDDLRINIETAVAAGFTAIQITPPGSKSTERIVRNHLRLE